LFTKIMAVFMGIVPIPIKAGFFTKMITVLWESYRYP
jgi:hypothetical protein